MEELKRRVPQVEASGIRIPWYAKILGGLLAFYIIVFRLLDLDSYLGFVGYQVGDKEVGIRFNANKPYEVVGPGIYNGFGFFESMKVIKTEDLPFDATDPKVLTKDRQSIGLVVRGTVRRPGVDKPHILLQNWSSYSTIYQKDELLVGARDKDNKLTTPGIMQSLAQQAMKVCVGDSTFDESVVGSARDKLRDCIDRELDKLAKEYGLEVRNIVVPDVMLDAKAEEALSQITQSRLATEVANQQKLQADAEALRTLATEQGRIRVEQGRIQEKAKQDETTAALEKKNQDAQYAVIEAKKKNELFEAAQNYQIARENSKVAEEKAKADRASQIAEAAIYQSSPVYADVKKTEAMAAAYKNTDKVIVPAGSNPIMVMGAGGNQNPSVNVQPVVNTPAKP